MKQWHKPTISIVALNVEDVISTSLQETAIDASSWWNGFTEGGIIE